MNCVNILQGIDSPMADIEKIREEALPQLFNELQRDKNLLKFKLPNSDDVYSTYITDIRKRKRALHFIAKYPRHFQKPTEETNPSRLRFEFFDRENIKYVFETEFWEVLREMIWVRFPEYVHRYQRRKMFRLEAPHGTRLYFKVNNIRYKLLVINVSLGGTLGVLASFTKPMEQEIKLKDSMMLKNVELLFPSGNRKMDGTIVNIKRCQVNRQKQNPVTNNFECAIEFKQISDEEKRNFSDLFYKWQREYLRKRKIMGA
jgi:c-di-GMP-binding flagellar brake protein YcgR